MLESLDMGGISRVSCVIADELAKYNEVTLYATLPQQSYFSTECQVVYGKPAASIGLKLKKLGAFLNFKVLGKEMNPWFVYRHEIQELLLYIKENQIETIILTARFISYATIIKKYFPEIKLIGWAHNNAHVYLERYYVKMKQYFVRGLSVLDTLVALTEKDVKTFSEYTKSAQLIYNPLTIKHEKKALLQSKIISFVGRIDFQHKGIDYLIEVAAKLPEGWKIIIAGTGTKEQIRNFYKMRKSCHAEEKIILAGKMGDQQLIKHYLSSSIYIMTSRWEGLPLVLAEAMSFGLPIIAFRQSGSDEVLAKGRYGLIVEQGNVQALSDKLHCLIEDDTAKVFYQQCSLERVKNFKLAHIIKKWERIV